MNRKDLITAVAERSGQPRDAVEEVLGVLGDVLGTALSAGDKVTLPGVLTAERVRRSERSGRNPQTGEALVIPASLGVRLTPVSSLKATVRDSDR